MIERRRLDEPIASLGWALLIGVAWVVSVLLLPSSIYGFNQLEASSLLPKILIVLCLIGTVVSFMVAVPSTAVITWAAYRYVKYSKVAATLIVRTDRPSYRPGDDVRVSISVETEQKLLISSGRTRLRRKFYNEGLGFSTLSESSLRPWGEQNLPPGESHEWTAVLSLPADAIKGRSKHEEISIVLDVSLRTYPRTDATVELVVLKADSPREDADQSKLKTARRRNLDLSRPLERARAPARFAWFEWLEHTGRQPTLEWKDDPVDSLDRFVWIASGDIWCANDPVRRVEFRFMRTDGGDWIFNEVSVHLEAGWAKSPVPGLHRLEITGPRSGAEQGWTGNDLGLGLIERLNADDSFGELWNELTISAKPLVGDPENEDLHARSVCRVLLTWTQVTRRPVLAWSKPPTESYDALDRLIDHIVAERVVAKWRRPSAGGQASPYFARNLRPLGCVVSLAYWLTDGRHSAHHMALVYILAEHGWSHALSDRCSRSEAFSGTAYRLSAWDESTRGHR